MTFNIKNESRIKAGIDARDHIQAYLLNELRFLFDSNTVEATYPELVASVLLLNEIINQEKE
jgi:hypothetical protein